MTKFVECIETLECLITRGKIYEVVDEKNIDGNESYHLKDDVGYIQPYPKDYFKEVEAPKEETNTFKFIPETEIQYVTVNGVKGILIKEE